jgi:ATP-dependent RNA helicase RhlE
MSTETFADLGVSTAVVNSLSGQGITAPFAVQKMVIRDVLAGRDVLVRSPTGSGKTLAFGVPLADRIASDGPRPAALILAPTRELATQITDDLRAIAHSRALRVTAVYGGVGLLKQSENAARSHILVATPGRLEDLLKRRAFSLKDIRVLVLDEADRMLDMGFRPAVDRIVNACPPNRQTLFFSATLDGEAGRVAKQYTQDAVAHENGPTDRASAKDIEHRFVSVTHEGRLDALVSELEQERDLALVFVRTKRGADRLVKRLDAVGIDSVAMHGNKSQRQRERALADFEAGRVDTLVATDVAARGIDVNGISHVINFDPPDDDDSYVHRIGRTGRAGRSGVGITLVAHAERGDVVRLAGRLGIEHGLGGGGYSQNSTSQGDGARAARPQGERSGQRPSRNDRPNRGESRGERPNRGESRGERPNRGERSGAPKRQGPSDRSGVPKRPGQPRGERPAHGDRPAYGERPNRDSDPKRGRRSGPRRPRTAA